MKSATSFAVPTSDEAILLEWEIQVARRADELAQRRRAASDPDDDRRCWLEAEEDVLCAETSTLTLSA